MHVTFFLTLLAVVSSQNADFYQCKSTAVCVCGRGTDSREMVCPRITAKHPDPYLKLQVRPQVAATYATLECQSAKEKHYEWLLSNPIGRVKEFRMSGCPIPSVSLGEFLTTIGIREVAILSLQAMEEKENVISKQTFQNLDSVTELSLYDFDKLLLTPGLFSDLVNLTSLDLRDNNVILSGDVFSNLKKLKRLELANVKLTHLEPGIFKPLRSLKMLNIWGNELKNLTRETFSGLENVTSLSLNSNGITSLPEDVFVNMSNLKNISLYGNNFTSLPQRLFAATPTLEVLKLHSNRKTLALLPEMLLANLTALKEVNLQDCNISQLPQNLIWGSVNISILQLSTNSIKNLPQAIFKDAKNLKELDLSYNKLETLPDNVFIFLEKLQKLHLNNNQLTTLTEAKLQGLSNLKALSLSNNALLKVDSGTFRSTRSLTEIYMSNNRLTFQAAEYSDYSPLQHCLQLEVIHLANNSIREIHSDWRLAFLKLGHLDLRYNHIKHLEVGDLNFVSGNLTLDLRNNQIKTIDLEQINLLANARDNGARFDHHKLTVRLDYNPIECDCGIYYFLKFLENRFNPWVYQLISMHSRNLHCNTPMDKAGIPVVQLSSRTLTCQLSRDGGSPIACPEQCSCLIRPEDKALIVDCNSAGLTEVPPALPKIVPNIELILDNNFIQSLPTKLNAGYSNVQKMSLSHNNITWLDNKSLSTNLKELRLDHNNLTRLDASLFHLWENRTNLTLHGNPWICDCDAMDFFNFLQTSFKQVEYLNNVTCSDGRSLARLTSKDICPVLNGTVIALSVTFAIVGIFIGLLAAIYFRYQNEVKIWLYAHNLCLQFVTEDELDKDKIYDAFVSYSHKDEDFVTNKLLPGLECGPTKFKLCVHYRDWIAGEFITTQIARSVQDSRRTLVVLSPNFIKSEWGRLEFRAAHKQALSEGRARVIVVIYGDLGSISDLDSELQAYLTTNTYVKWGDPWFWNKLRYALPHRSNAHKGIMSNYQFQTSKDDKLELVTPTTPAVTTPPTDIIKNPLEIGNGYINHSCNEILKQENGHINNAVKCV